MVEFVAEALDTLIVGLLPVVYEMFSLSVNRVETPAFQAGRFQHRSGISIDENCRCSKIAV